MADFGRFSPKNDHFWPFLTLPHLPPFFRVFELDEFWHARARAWQGARGPSVVSRLRDDGESKQENLFFRNKSLTRFAMMINFKIKIYNKNTVVLHQIKLIYCLQERTVWACKQVGDLFFTLILFNHNFNTSLYDVPRSVDTKRLGAMMLTITNVTRVSPERTEIASQSITPRNAFGWTFSNLRRRAKRIVWGLKIFYYIKKILIKKIF